MSYPRKYATAIASVDRQLMPNDWDAMVDIANGLSAGGQIHQYPHKFIVRLNGGTDWEAISAYGVLTYGGATDVGGIDGASFDAVMNAAVAAGSSIYVYTAGVATTWNVNTVPAAKIIEADDSAYFVIKHSTPDVAASYITIGAQTILINVSIWDYSGIALVAAGAMTINGPRACGFYYNRTNMTLNISNYPDQVILADVGYNPVASPLSDRPGIAVIEWGWGDAFYAGVNGRGTGMRVVPNAADMLGSFLVAPASAATNHFAVYDEFITNGRMLSFYHFGSNFSGIGLCQNFAVGSGAFTGDFAAFSVNNIAKFIIDHLGGIKQYAPNFGSLLSNYQLWVDGDTRARLDISGDGFRLTDGTNPTDVGFVRTGAANTWACYGHIKPYTTEIYDLGDINFLWSGVFANTMQLATGGDTQPRVYAGSTGIWMGSGAAAVDCRLYRNAANQLATEDQLVCTDGVVTKVVADAVDDGDFTVDTDGLIAIDSANHRIYFRYGGGWHYCNQTAGFQIPKEEKICPVCTKPILKNQFVCGQVNGEMKDGALHGVWVHLKCAQ